jgi:hypothetical protein
LTFEVWGRAGILSRGLVVDQRGQIAAHKARIEILFGHGRVAGLTIAFKALAVERKVALDEGLDASLF